jgi:type IV pilus assembly protein PilN
MAHINLLPWREARREELKRAFLSILGLVVAAAVVVTMAADRFVNAQIDNQKARNDYISKNIASSTSR